MLRIGSFLFFFVCFFSFVAQICAQTSTQLEEIEKLSKSIHEVTERTAVFENGQLKSVNVPLFDASEMTVTFIWGSDGRSVTIITGGGDEFLVRYNDKRQIETVALPNNEVATFIRQIVDGSETTTDVIIGTGPSAISMFNLAGAVPGSDCEAALRNMRNAVVSAAVTCWVSPGPACWGAAVIAVWAIREARNACQ